MKRILFISTFLFISSILWSPDLPTVLYIEEAQPIIHIDINEVKALLKAYKIKHRDIVLAQIRLETGNLKSTICLENKNLFGMKVATQRPTTAIGEQYGHAVYKSFNDCVKDYLIWQQKYYKEGDYYVFLARMGYSENSLYASIVQTIVKQMS